VTVASPTADMRCVGRVVCGTARKVWLTLNDADTLDC
jgi:hypothetical protein